MSIARHHAEWLSLVPVSGPFLSLPVLMEAFNAGLEPHDPDQSRLLRQEYGNWEESFEKRKTDPAPHQQWITFVLTKPLELDDRVLVEGQAIPQTLHAEVPEHHELLRPSIVVIDPNTKKPRLLVQTYPRSQDLTNYVVNSPWKASPDTRMTELLHATGVRLGLVTNGEHWMLVDAPKGETTGYASWYASLWLEEPITLRAFRSVLSASRFFNVPDDQTLEALLTKSASNQQEVTEQLGYQVRRAVEVLIHSLDRADQDFGRELLAGMREDVLYEAALTVMMRLVFLFCAEERELIPSKPFPVYEQHYSVSAISKQLRELADQHGEELLERRYDAWPRLLAAFRAVYGGLRHDDVHIPAYGGNLFNPDRFPFLEGRKRDTSWRDTEANPLPVNNRTVLHLLEALQLLQIKVPGGGPAEARRLSFRALDIEQIGHVYEGLLDHTAKRATEPFLGLSGTRDKEPEIPLAELEGFLAKGEADLVKALKDATGKSESALKKSLTVELDTRDAARLRTACQSDDALWKRVQPLAGFVREDSFGYPVVIPTGSVFVTAGTDRRSSGTHYTPRSLTEPIVQYTLEPLVYVGPAEGKPKSDWTLKSAAELSSLKICDMACGSGAFLVQAARYMAERLLEAWDEARKANPQTVGITPEGRPSTGKVNEALVPDDPAERKTYAMRIIAQRCLYGVDKNPLAAEMAKLSLWLLTLAKDKPFEFLDHSIRCGDSLVGLHDMAQLRHFSLKPDADDAVLFKGPLDSAVDEAITLRLKLEDLPVNSVDDVERQERLLKEANQKIARLRCAADLLVAAEFWGESAKDKLEKVRHASNQSMHFFEKGPTEEFEQVAGKERRGQTMFHWPLEFPEVVVTRGGFDAFVCNPPFIGNKYWGERLTGDFTAWASVLLDGRVGKIDYAVLFLRRAFSLGAAQGHSGFIATRAVHEGGSRSVGLGVIASEGVIYRAHTQLPWPGTAGVHVSLVWFARHRSKIEPLLDGNVVDAITSELSSGATEPEPYPLTQCLKAFQGSHNGKGESLTLAPKEEWFLKLKKANSPFLRPFVTSDDIASSGMRVLPRWIVDTENLPLDEVKRRCPTTWMFLHTVVKPHRTADVLSPYRGLFDRWWQLWNHRAPLYHQLRKRDTCLVLPFVAKHAFVAEAPTEWVFTNKLCVVERVSDTVHASLVSNLFEAWIRRYGGTRGKTRMTLSLAAGVLSFPTLNSGVPETATLLAEWRKCFGAMEKVYSEAYTSIWNGYHSSDDHSEAVVAMRNTRSLIDRVIADAYGLRDIDLTCDFIARSEGIRYTISEPARREVLHRLLKLNHERYAEEVKQGLHAKKGAAKKAPSKKKTTRNPAKGGSALFDMDKDYE